MHTTVYKITHEPTVSHRALYPILCDNLYAKRFFKKKNKTSKYRDFPYGTVVKNN